MTPSAYVTGQEAKKLLGVSTLTLRRWAGAGKLGVRRTAGNQRRYHIPEGLQNVSRVAKQDIVYVRVSSAKQRDDLARQTYFIHERFPDHQVVSDVGSGINFKRKGLLSILERAQQGSIGQVVVASRDRLCRFAFELVEWLLTRNGASVLVLDAHDQSPEQELSDDLMSIVQIFCCRRNGRRRYGRREGAAGQAEAGQEAAKAVARVRGRGEVDVQREREDAEPRQQDHQADPEEPPGDGERQRAVGEQGMATEDTEGRSSASSLQGQGCPEIGSR
jgi:putative resolvase